MVQSVYRKYRAHKILMEVCISRYQKRYDPDRKVIFYTDVVTGKVFEAKPLLLGECLDVNMDPRDELFYEQDIKKNKEKERIKLAFAEREEKRQVDRKKQNEEKEFHIRQEIEAKWNAPFIAAERTGELIANWKDFVEIDPHVHNLAPKLTVIRLIGNPLVRLPGALFTQLTKIVVLGLSNCHLVELPEEITSLNTLEDLNLIKNELEHLPKDIGSLIQLKQLSISANNIKVLPDSFSKLVNLPRLNLERNQLPKLPDNFGDLKCKMLSLGKIGLTQLPRSIDKLASTLVSLNADNNQLTRIPREIGKLVNLQNLSLCNNQILRLPDEICSCLNLEKLWLDWNKIQELPPDFLKLEKLISLHLEGNPMSSPSMDIIIKGVEKTKEWFQVNVNMVRVKEQKHIVLHLQSMLAIMYQEGLLLPQYFQPGLMNETIGDRNDMFFAIVQPYLFENIIPEWNRYVNSLKTTQIEPLVNKYRNLRRNAFQVQEMILAKLISNDEEEEKQLLQEERRELDTLQQLHLVQFLPEPFHYSADETLSALSTYTDAYGKIYTESHIATFKLCRCNNGTHPVVCVPPNLHFRCERQAQFLKMNLVSFFESVKRESMNTETDSLNERLTNCELEVTKYVKSEQGARYFDECAEEEAIRILEEERQDKYILKKTLVLLKKKEKRENNRKRKMAGFEKSKLARIDKLNNKKKTLIGLLERSRGWEAEKCQDELRNLEDEFENHPQDVELNILRDEQEEDDETFTEETRRDNMLEDYSSIGAVSQLIKGKGELRLRTARVRTKLVQAYLEAEKKIVVRNTRREYGITRRILFNWMNLNVRTIFFTWRTWTQKRMFWKRRDTVRSNQLEELVEASGVVDRLYMEEEQKKWLMCIDPFTDVEYWQHCETGQIKNEQPALEDCFFIPRVLMPTTISNVLVKYNY